MTHALIRVLKGLISVLAAVLVTAIITVALIATAVIVVLFLTK